MNAAVLAPRRTGMEKLKIEKGASKVRRTPLKVTIDATVADDLELMAQWSENDSSYLVNLLLRFAIGQSEDFQRHKAEQTGTLLAAETGLKTGPDPLNLEQLGEKEAP
jgi:hypothetical protein